MSADGRLGPAEVRRVEGEAFYDRGFCRMVNRASLLLLDGARDTRPGLDARALLPDC